MYRWRIDVADAGLDPFGNTEGPGNVATEHGGGEAVFGVIGHTDGLINAADPDDGDDGTKTFLAIDAHGRGHMIDNRGRHDRATSVSASRDHRTFGNGIIDQAADAVAGSCAHQRAQHDVALAGVAVRQTLRLGGEFGDKRVSDLVVDYDPFGRHADLALVHESPEGSRVHSRIKIGILEDDEWGLTAEFE